MGNVWYFVYDYEMCDVMSCIRKKTAGGCFRRPFCFSGRLKLV